MSDRENIGTTRHHLKDKLLHKDFKTMFVLFMACRAQPAELDCETHRKKIISIKLRFHYEKSTVQSGLNRIFENLDQGNIC